MRAVPQFGERRSDRTYVDRAAAFGILEREGQIALVHIVKADGASWHDLPGGGVDEGEVAEQGVALPPWGRSLGIAALVLWLGGVAAGKLLLHTYTILLVS